MVQLEQRLHLLPLLGGDGIIPLMGFAGLTEAEPVRVLGATGVALRSASLCSILLRDIVLTRLL